MDKHEAPDLKLAVLIDADNVPYRVVKGMMEEIAKYGTATTKRIYGDWTKPTVRGWKSVLLEHAITPVQQYSYTTGKNATDSAMIIDAMDILYSEKVDGFCIVSSDSDFTRLATRLRESGMRVIGLGEKKTPDPFIVACDRFIFLEILIDQDEEEDSSTGATKRKTTKAKKPAIPKKVQRLIATTIDDLSDEDGWAFLGEVGSLLIKKQPSFDPRNYGFDKLTPLLKSMSDLIEIDVRDSEGKGRFKHVYARLKKKVKS
ncbi:MAG: NYN domain-containing protein [Bacteroidetes bacterium]|nr:MAG: NYN domain-containing protein [Bacteroidota bacterium]